MLALVTVRLETTELRGDAYGGGASPRTPACLFLSSALQRRISAGLGGPSRMPPDTPPRPYVRTSARELSPSAGAGGAARLARVLGRRFAGNMAQMRGSASVTLTFPRHCSSSAAAPATFQGARWLHGSRIQHSTTPPPASAAPFGAWPLTVVRAGGGGTGKAPMFWDIWLKEANTASSETRGEAAFGRLQL